MEEPLIHISLKAEEVFHIGSFPVTNSYLMSTLALLLLVGVGIVLQKKIKLVPAGIQNIAEVGLEGLLTLMESVLGARAKAEKYLPLIATIFLFVLVSNWLGIFELISEFAKIVSFSFRLYGNIFAGDVLLTIVGFLMPFVAPLPFFFLELFVGFVQAFVFAMLGIV